MSWHALSLWIGIGLMALIAPARAATPEQVDKAIANAQKFLLTHKYNSMNWEQVPKPLPSTDKENRMTDVNGRQWGGLTAVCTYALLASGINPQDPQIRDAVEFLLHANIQSTYGLGFGSQIVSFIPEKEARPFMRHNVQMILHGMIPVPPGRMNDLPPASGFYGYWTGFPEGTTTPTFKENEDPRKMGTHQPGEHYDRSNSQYAVLGMWAMEEAGGEIPSVYWQIEDKAWKQAQRKDGGWNYNGKEDPTPSMTAAGIATLFITQDYTLELNWGACNGGAKNVFLDAGLAWMDKHIHEALGGDLYTMYGVERIGAASGRKYFGTLDWYQLGADWLIKNQRPDGSWHSRFPGHVDTSFGLVFLSRGRAPILMNKLQYEAPTVTMAWDERPRDVANLARWVGRQTERYFNWQVVNLKVPVEELHDAPILYLSGSQKLAFSDEEVKKLRSFVEQGGLILGNADCAREPFVNTFKELGDRMFKDRKYKFAKVAPSDLIYREQFKTWRTRPQVLALDNGVRHLMLLIPDADPSRAWQTRSYTTREPLFQIGANIFLYAVDQNNLQTKGQTHIVTSDPKVPTTQQISLARLNVGDNPDPEPYGWIRLAAILHNKDHVELKHELVKPDGLANFKIAHLTGTGQLKLTDAQRGQIKQFVQNGGTLIIDAAGGDTEFADSVELDLGRIFGEKKLEPLPDDSPVYEAAGEPIKAPGWRRFAVERVADRKHPHVRGITVGERLGVLFSREDLSAGLVGQNVDGIYGYDPQTATKLMEAMALYASGMKPAPQTAPAVPPPSK